MEDEERSAPGFKDRLARGGEDALGKIAQELLESPIVSGAISRAFEARERAVQAQEAAMGALNLPSAADVDRLTRRLRSVSQRLEGIEDVLDRVDRRVESTAKSMTADDRLAAIEAQLTRLAGEVAALAHDVARAPAVSPEQGSLDDEAAPAGVAAPEPAKPKPRGKAKAEEQPPVTD